MNSEMEDVSKHIEKRGNYYWLKDKDGDEAGPICSFCWDYEKKNIYVAKEEGIFGSSPTFWCSICKARHILLRKHQKSDVKPGKSFSAT